MKFMMKNNSIKKYIQLYTAFIIYSGVTIFSKMAAMEPQINIRVLMFLGGEIVSLALYAILWQQALKYFDLTVAMANKGSVVIISMLWSALIFHEKISLFNVIGASVIIIGIRMVLRDD